MSRNRPQNMQKQPSQNLVDENNELRQRIAQLESQLQGMGEDMLIVQASAKGALNEGLNEARRQRDFWHAEYDKLKNHQSMLIEVITELKNQLQKLIPAILWNPRPAEAKGTRAGITIIVETSDGEMQSYMQGAIVPEEPHALLDRLTTLTAASFLQIPLTTDIARNPETYGIDRDMLMRIITALTPSYYEDRADYSRLKNTMLEAVWNEAQAEGRYVSPVKEDFFRDVSRIIKETFQNAEKHREGATFLIDTLGELRQKLATRNDSQTR